ncbi:hypothetical protein GCM10010429_53180 [Micromonospora olivasterospora]
MRRVLACLAAALVASPVVMVAQAASAATTPAALVIGSDFPDPDVIKVGGTYYAYSTNNGNGNVPVATVTSLTGPWTRRPDALPTLGPFAPVGTGPLVCNGGEGGDIDASSFVDGTGLRYLLYKDDGNAIGQPTSLWLQQVAADGVTRQGARVELLRNDRPEEAGVIEAPVLTRVGARYVLFYSLGGYGGDGYQTSYATSTSLTGPYAKAYRSLLTTASVDGAVRGPGGADVDATVFAPRAGGYTAHIAYAAGSGDATHTLTVNGGAAQVVSYPNTGWETWRQVRADITLNAGWNTLRLTHRDRWAELDFVEIA